MLWLITSIDLMNILSFSGSGIAALLSGLIFFKTTNRERARMLIRKTTKITCTQDTWKTGESFRHYFNAKFIIANQSSLPNAVLSVKSYFFIDDKWKEDEVIASEQTTLPLNIQPLCTIPFEINAVKWVKGEPGKDNEERSKSHSSLPNTLKIRLEFEMLCGKPITIDMEYTRSTE